MNKLTKKLLSVFLSTLLFFGSAVSAFSSAGKAEIDYTNLINKDILTYFKITDNYKSGGNNLVIWIQDLHNDYETQNKIYKVLENLTKKYDFEIYSEGVIDNTLDVSLLNSIPNKKIKEETINTLFKNSVLSACEYFALSNKEKNISGIEDKKEYINNLVLLDKINKNKDFNNYIVTNIINQVNELKQQNLVEKVLSLQILKLNEINIPDNYPNLQKYQTVSKTLSDINSKKLNSQFKNFVSNNKISSSVYDLLKLQSDYGYAQIYDYIDSNLPEFKQNNKELVMYLQSNKLLFEINSVDLLYEKELFISNLLNNESLDQNEREIIDLDKYAGFLRDLVNVNILPSHYNLLKENKKYFTELLQKYLSEDSVVFALHLLNDNDLFSFFDTNIDRNEIFVNKLTKDNSNKIVVAGGFHSDITNKLKNLNISYIVLTPNMSLANAFNNLFSTTLKYGTDEQIASNILSIVSSWQNFFTDKDSFQKEIDKWIADNPSLQDKLSVTLYPASNYIVVTYNGVMVKKELNGEVQTKKVPNLSKKQQKLLAEDITKVAKQYYLFGEDVEVRISDEEALLNNMMPMTVKNIDEKPVIFVNSKFINALYLNPYLIQSAVKFLYYSTSEVTDTDSFVSFVNNNYEDLESLYEITKNLKKAKSPILFTVKTRIKHALDMIKAGISNFEKVSFIQEPSEEELKTDDDKYMAEALKQATLARQTRSFLKSFTQPPIGAFIVNADGITGKNYNHTSSILHAETLTFIDFLQNCIQKDEKLPTGELTEKGKFLNELLELAKINGENINNKVFQNRPALLENLGIQIDYSQRRDINMVFEESNAVLKFVSMQLGNPLASATLYCTLAPCNKCSQTMIDLGINKLVYGSYLINKNHKSINNILNAGIRVVDGVLLKQCNERIVNYRFMNLSVFRTKIASSIQFVRRLLPDFYQSASKYLNDLISNISFSETNILDLKYDILDLQQKIDWTDLQANQQEMEKLIDVLKDTGAYDDKIKRATMIYVIKNKCLVKTENGNIVFYNKENKKMDFYINIVGKLVLSPNYSMKMEQLATVMNFADMDDNLAVRNTAFNKDMQAVFSTLTLYGIGQPIPITGNTLQQTKKRLDPLGKEIKSLIPEIYIENATMQYSFADGEYKNNEHYMNDIAKSVLEPEVMDYLKNLFGDIQQEWYDNLVFFVEQTRRLRKQQYVTYEDFVEVLLQGKPKYEEIENIIDFYGNLPRALATKELSKVYDIILEKGFNEKEFKEIMKILSLLELSRLYFSRDEKDLKESGRIKQDIDTMDKGININLIANSDVRYVVTAFRPTLVREQVTKYYRRIIQKKYDNLAVISSGQTTISVYKENINKTIPLDYAIKTEAGYPTNIIYTGDEFNEGGVDYPVYELQQKNGYNRHMVVINTNVNPFEGNFITLSEIDGFDTTTTVDGNIKRNLLLQKMILSIIEENINLIATDSEYEPVEVAQELKSRILSQNVIDFEAQAQKPEILNIADMLKAG
ncbi:MAG: hypothetical protein K5622_05080 [Endomicrobiaceae bacterium]|nr:hypothetical protein [Endomicrobiaceae bacterium]